MFMYNVVNVSLYERYFILHQHISVMLTCSWLFNGRRLQRLCHSVLCDLWNFYFCCCPHSETETERATIYYVCILTYFGLMSVVWSSLNIDEMFYLTLCTLCSVLLSSGLQIQTKSTVQSYTRHLQPAEDKSKFLLFNFDCLDKRTFYELYLSLQLKRLYRCGDCE